MKRWNVTMPILLSSFSITHSMNGEHQRIHLAPFRRHPKLVLHRRRNRCPTRPWGARFARPSLGGAELHAARLPPS